MTDIVFVFEVHQPHRLRQNFFWEHKAAQRMKKDELFNYYFDRMVDKEIFLRASKKCYLPSNQILLNAIDEYKKSKKQVKVAFSISGVFLEQCEMFHQDLLESFKQLAETGCVEFLGQTYYHSLASLYPDRVEFTEQVKMHQQTMKDLLGYTPEVFENTELIYNNAIAKTVEKLGYKGIFTEGIKRILKGKSPNYLYTPKNCRKIKVLLRNYELTDDLGFRFSAKWWSEWPLTADKYASWLSATPGQCINLFPDYETFGEHQWPETGIHEFLRHLPGNILDRWNLRMSTPSEVIENYCPVGEIDVSELGETISWADIERDTSCWLGNTMQWAYYTAVKRLEPLLREVNDEDFLEIWRYLQTSDHLYYMFTSGGGPGEVHSYFSPFDFPTDAFVTAHSAVLDFENRLRLFSVAANHPFMFYTGKGKKHYTGTTVWSLMGFVKALEEVEIESIEFHTCNGHFEKWVETSIRDEKLAKQMKKIRNSKMQGRELRKGILKVATDRLKELRREIQSTQYF
ncbi:MAG: glycoside hydrolase family 57 protein [Thermoproteota archaeon]